MKKADLITGSVFAFFSLLVISASYRFPVAKDGVPGPGTWPIIIAAVMLFASILIIVQGLKNAQTEDKAVDIASADSIRVYVSMVSLIAYLLLMNVLGFVISTIIMLFLFIKRLGNYKWHKTLFVSAVVTAVVYGVFKYVLKVPFRFGFLL
ncbi:tripartite tricarboxylate transporter TctB family protein [Treponema sp. HNW]|uniref:tripartite tricarboxylate transporter TctB family protein n=1 Tax=Treponema sp. HNW TaxID=3116654 RepID=UPI003D0CEAB6